MNIVVLCGTRYGRDMIRQTQDSDAFRATLLLGGLVLIACLVWAFGVLEPAVAFPIPRSEMDRIVGSNFWLTMAGVAAAIATIPLGIGVGFTKPATWVHPSRARMVWARANGAAGVFGLVVAVFAVSEGVSSFGYLALDDAYPGGFPHGLPWFSAIAMMIAAPVLGAALVSSVAFVLSGCKHGAVSENTSETDHMEECR